MPAKRLALATNTHLNENQKTEMQPSVIKKTLFLAVLLATNSAWAEWVQVADNSNGKAYIDTETIRKDGNLVRVWQITNLKERHKDGELSRRFRFEYDCKQESYRFMSFSEHSEPMAGGNTLQNGTGDGIWRDLPPNSVGEAVLKKVCR